MDAQDFCSLQEAYLEVYNELDEAIRNPESRAKLRDIEDREVRKGDKSKGENPRSKYPNEKGKLAGHLLRGPESTGSPGNPVRSRGGTNAPADERVGRGPHRAGNAAYWARNAGPNRDRGAGNKAARRSGKSVANTRDMDENYDVYDIILSHLLDEGYAETPEAAEVIMVNMSEEWRESIVEEMLDERNRGEQGMSDREVTRRRNLGGNTRSTVSSGALGDHGSQGAIQKFHKRKQGIRQAIHKSGRYTRGDTGESGGKGRYEANKDHADGYPSITKRGQGPG